MLAKLEEFSYLQKYCSTSLNARALGGLLLIQRDKLLSANKEEVQFFAKPIDRAIKMMVSNPELLPPRIRYRLQKVRMGLDVHGK